MKKNVFKIISVVLTLALVLPIITLPVAAYDKELSSVLPDPPGLMEQINSPIASKREVASPLDYGPDLGPKLFGKAEIVSPPKMGWNSWNAFWTQVTQWNVAGIADSFIRLGLDKVGFEYVVVDDGNFAGSSLWNQRATTRNAASNYRIEENLWKFPDGFKANVDYVHSLGLKYGMYGDVGTATCNGFHVGSWGYEDLDALTYAEWGVDYIKYDCCNNGAWGGVARKCYSPYIRSVTLSNTGGFTQKTAANTGVMKNGARLSGSDVYYIGGASKLTGYQAIGELILTVEVPADGNYKLELEYSATASGSTGYGRWVSIDVNGNGNRVIDQYVPATGAVTTFSTADLGNIALKAGENTLRFCNFGRMETALYQYAAFADGMKKAMDKTGHDMVLSLCEWGDAWSWAWGYKISDSWRTTNDIMLVRAGGHCFWKSQYYTDNASTVNSYSLTKCYNENVILDEFAGITRGWNDADMLIVGCKNLCYTTTAQGTWPQRVDLYNIFGPIVGELSADGTTVYVPGTTTPITVSSSYRNPATGAKPLTFEEEESHFNVWCVMNSVLMLGFDLRNLNKGDDTWKVITNEDVIALNQDILGVQAKRVKIDNPAHVIYPTGSSTSAASIQHLDALAKPLANGDMGLLFFNVDDVPRTITLTMDEIVNNKDGFSNTNIAPKIVNKAGQHDNGSAFLGAGSYFIKDLRTKKITQVNKTGAFELSRFDSTVDVVIRNQAATLDRPSDYTSVVTFENGEFKVSLAPHASATYRISYGDSFTFNRELLKEGGAKISATAIQANSSQQDVDVMVVIARYNDKGQLVDVKMGEKQTIEKGASEIINLAYNLSEEQSGQTLKAFLWDANTYIPLTEALSWNP